MEQGASVAVVAFHADKYSETFIHGHVDGLRGDVEFLHGGFFPTASDSGVPPTYPILGALSAGLARLTGRQADSIAAFLVRKIPGLTPVDGLARYLRRSGFDVVLAEYGPTGVEMMGPCRRAGVPLVVHFHGYDAYERRVLEVHGEAYRELFRQAAAVVAVSRDMARQLEELGAPPEKVVLRPYGVDLDKFCPPDVSPSEPLALSVGRFVEKKAPHLTILAFREAVRSVPSARLHMIGDGPLLDSCRTLVEALGLSEQVRFHGAVPHEAVVEWMGRAFCYVQHSVVAPNGDSEGTPVSILEAAASGLPVVATRHAGIVDVIRDGDSGFLVEEGDVEGMGSAMTDLLSDPDRASTMGMAARRRVEEDYDRDDAMRELRDILESAAEPAGSGQETSILGWRRALGSSRRRPR